MLVFTSKKKWLKHNNFPIMLLNQIFVDVFSKKQIEFWTNIQSLRLFFYIYIYLQSYNNKKFQAIKC